MEFRDLKRQYEVNQKEIDKAVREVCESGGFISGPQVRELEQELAEYIGVKHCIACANGTDALSLALMAWGIGAGDAVFVPDFTFFSSGECVAYAGAVPVFVDVCAESFNMDPDKLEQAVQRVKKDGRYSPKAVITVDLFGLPADYPRLRQICDKYHLYLLEDGAQGFGGSRSGKRACSFGDISTTSFFPAKPLGCYGDGGAVFTDNDAWASLIRSYAVHGKDGNDKYRNIRIGINSRLDTIQAAVLLIKLKAFQDYELDAVNRAAGWYALNLRDSGLILPSVPAQCTSSWAQYTVRTRNREQREKLQAALQARQIPSMIYYPRPMHMQEAFAGLECARADCPVTEKLCETVLSLPIHPYMEKEELAGVVEAIRGGMDT